MALMVAPSDRALSDPIRLAPVARPVSPASQLPAPLSALIGRDEEVASLAALLAQPDVRLLTLVGPGGVGKTRLALAVATAVEHHYDAGVVLVALAATQEPALVPSAIAQALGVRERSDPPLPETLIAALRPQHMLLVLDNL